MAFYGTGYMDQYYGEHAFGTPADDPEAGIYHQGYGLSDLHSLYEGMGSLYTQQLQNWSAGVPTWVAEYQPGAYSMEESGENLVRDAFSQGYKGYRADIADLTASTKGQIGAARSKTSQAGFAGGGRASRGIAGELRKMNVATSGITADWQASQEEYKQDVIGLRADYANSLWNAYNSFTAGLDTIYDPAGGWDNWRYQYG